MQKELTQSRMIGDQIIKRSAATKKIFPGSKYETVIEPRWLRMAVCSEAIRLDDCSDLTREVAGSRRDAIGR
jgi:hypothetical protein